jgi:hypothetical protein
MVKEFYVIEDPAGRKLVLSSDDNDDGAITDDELVVEHSWKGILKKDLMPGKYDVNGKFIE